MDIGSEEKDDESSILSPQQGLAKSSSQRWKKIKSNVAITSKIANRIDSANFIGEDLKFSEDSIESLTACTLQLGIALPSSDERVQLTVNDQTCFFQEYCPDTFRDIRKSLDVCEVEYKAILGLYPSAISTCVRSTLRFIGTRDASGKSNSWFLFSPDMRICLKTSNSDEVELLQNVLSSYSSHCDKAPNTLLPHFYGLYRVDIGKNVFWFIAQKNVLASKRPIVERYDVKGSTFNRQASQRELAKQTHAVLKDWDLVSRQRFLCVRSSEEKDRLMELLTADVAWLQRHGLIDYSFLIGYMANTSDPDHPTPEHSAGVSTGEINGIDVSRGGNPLLKQTSPLKKSESICSNSSNSGKDNRFAIHLLTIVDPDFSAALFGIIDILTQYGVRKQVEHCCLGVLANRPGASCQPPLVYGSRLIRFVDMIVMALDGGGDGEAGNTQLRTERTLLAKEWFATHGRKGGKDSLVWNWRKYCGCFLRRGVQSEVQIENKVDLFSAAVNSNGYESVN